MANQRNGFIDSLQSSRLSWLSGTAYPAAPAGVYLGLYGGTLPGSDGTGGNEISSAGRQAVVFSAPTQDAAGRWTCANTGVVSFTVPAVPSAVCSLASGSTRPRRAARRIIPTSCFRSRMWPARCSASLSAAFGSSVTTRDSRIKASPAGSRAAILSPEFPRRQVVCPLPLPPRRGESRG